MSFYIVVVAILYGYHTRQSETIFQQEGVKVIKSSFITLHDNVYFHLAPWNRADCEDIATNLIVFFQLNGDSRSPAHLSPGFIRTSETK